LEADHFLGGKSAMAVRRGQWKLIEFLKTGKRELYDLAADPSEENDLARAKPELAREMGARLAAWRTATVKRDA
jgi:arylsulfatase A-like enzyme